MHIPELILGISFLCLLFWVFVFTNHKQFFIRMHRNAVAVNLYEFNTIRSLYQSVITGRQPLESLIKRIQLFQVNIQKTIENATVIINTSPAYRDKSANKTYIDAVNKSNERLERIGILAKNFEQFISKRHPAP